MEISVNGKKRKLAFKGTVLQLCKKLGMAREETVAKVDGRLVPDDAMLSGNEKVEFFTVIFGG
jgi:sulfur carrier protein ThiS